MKIVVAIIVFAALAVIASEARKRRAKESRRKALDYYLPIVMERIVMAVESGLDILPAINAVVALESKRSAPADPVTQVLCEIQRYAENGVGFIEALSYATAKIDAPSIKHAMVHLGIAYSEGGEIIHPLRELSDATQLYYQETVEEEIAKMPVKATMPLLCTFAGLIILFLTTPIIQVMKIAGQAIPQ